jgi:hypothetical protein
MNNTPSSHLLTSLVSLTTALVLLSSCTAGHSPNPFNPKTCFEEIPDRVEGLEILSGDRTRRSIIRDMVPGICHGHALFHRMRDRGEAVAPGTVLLRVRVEYTGEVYEVSVEKSTIESESFLRRLRGFVMDSDFTVWARGNEETLFLYPAAFGD